MNHAPCMYEIEQNSIHIILARRWSNVVSIVTRLQTRTSEVQLPLGAKRFSLLQNVLLILPFHGYRGPFTGVKRTVFEGSHSPQSSDEINPLNAELNPICHLLILLGDLIFMVTCIVSIFQYISNKIQRYTVYLYLETALHVSGGTFIHHQERIHLV
jgi:hypothetical protein